jgi:hypothetical protein
LAHVERGSVTRFNTGVLESTLPTSCAATPPAMSPETVARAETHSIFFMIILSCETNTGTCGVT